MKITLNQAEIEEALTQYIGNQGVSTEGKDIAVQMTAGRGPSGYTADVEITPSRAQSNTPTPRNVSPIVEPSEHTDIAEDLGEESSLFGGS